MANHSSPILLFAQLDVAQPNAKYGISSTNRMLDSMASFSMS